MNIKIDNNDNLLDFENSVNDIEISIDVDEFTHRDSMYKNININRVIEIQSSMIISNLSIINLYNTMVNIIKDSNVICSGKLLGFMSCATNNLNNHTYRFFVEE